MTTFFCPCCFAKIAPEARVCPECGCDIADYARTDYDERLCHTLQHPESEARMGAIISLGRRAPRVAVEPLKKCLLAWPRDVVQAEAILDALAQIRAQHRDEAGLVSRVDALFAEIGARNPSMVVRRLAKEIASATADRPRDGHGSAP